MEPNPYASPQQPAGLLPSANTPQRIRKPYHWVIMGIWLVIIVTMIFHARISWLHIGRRGFSIDTGLPAPVFWTIQIGFPIFMSAMAVYHIVRAWRGLPEHFWKKPSETSATRDKRRA